MFVDSGINLSQKVSGSTVPKTGWAVVSDEYKNLLGQDQGLPYKSKTGAIPAFLVHVDKEGFCDDARILYYKHKESWRLNAIGRDLAMYYWGTDSDTKPNISSSGKVGDTDYVIYYDGAGINNF